MEAIFFLMIVGAGFFFLVGIGFFVSRFYRKVDQGRH